MNPAKKRGALWGGVLTSCRESISRDGRYSRADEKEHLLRQLEMMMDDANSEKERDAIRRCIGQMENA